MPYLHANTSRPSAAAIGPDWLIAAYKGNRGTMNTKLSEPAILDSGDFRLEEFLPFQLSATTSRVTRMFAKRFADELGLSIPEWRVLAVVGRFGTASPSMVSEWAAMDKVKVSRAAATLVARGLLKQTQDPSDGRARLLRLTRKGTGVHQAAVPLARALEQHPFYLDSRRFGRRCRYGRSC